MPDLHHRIIGLDLNLKVTGLVNVGWLVVLGLTALWETVFQSIDIGPSPKEREEEERKDRWE